MLELANLQKERVIKAKARKHAAKTITPEDIDRMNGRMAREKYDLLMQDEISVLLSVWWIVKK